MTAVRLFYTAYLCYLVIQKSYGIKLFALDFQEVFI